MLAGVLVASGSAGATGSGDQSAVQTALPSPPDARCSAVKLPVRLLPGGPKRYTIAGERCVPSGSTPATVQVLLAGATYDRYFWNPAFHPEKYSYVWAATAAGYATLNIDPLGTGASSHPNSGLVTIESTAYTVHQLIQAVRAGSLGQAFSRVVLVGHSMGTAVAWNEIANYQDVDGLIAADNVHIPNLVGAVNDSLTLYPAMLDPGFAKLGLDPGYLTTRPGTRSAAFYHTSDADPAMISYDEAHKQVVTATFMATYFAEDVDLDSSRIRVPVLVAAGQDDQLMCGQLGLGRLLGVVEANCTTSSTLLRSEAPYYSNPATCLQAFVLPDAGHDIDLSFGASKFFAVANRWANRWVGRTGGAPTHNCTGPVGPAT